MNFFSSIICATRGHILQSIQYITLYLIVITRRRKKKHDNQTSEVQVEAIQQFRRRILHFPFFFVLCHLPLQFSWLVFPSIFFQIPLPVALIDFSTWSIKFWASISMQSQKASAKDTRRYPHSHNISEVFDSELMQSARAQAQALEPL